jgi:hypothetical protein
MTVGEAACLSGWVFGDAGVERRSNDSGGRAPSGPAPELDFRAMQGLGPSRPRCPSRNQSRAAPDSISGSGSDCSAAGSRLKPRTIRPGQLYAPIVAEPDRRHAFIPHAPVVWERIRHCARAVSASRNDGTCCAPAPGTGAVEGSAPRECWDRPGSHAAEIAMGVHAHRSGSAPRASREFPHVVRAAQSRSDVWKTTSSSSDRHSSRR